MARELLEETGIKAAKHVLADCFGGSGFRYIYPNGHRVEYSIFLFLCAGELQENTALDPETVELQYFSRAEFPGLQLPYPIDALYTRST